MGQSEEQILFLEHCLKPEVGFRRIIASVPGREDLFERYVSKGWLVKDGGRCYYVTNAGRRLLGVGEKFDSVQRRIEAKG